VALYKAGLPDVSRVVLQTSQDESDRWAARAILKC